MLSCKHNKHHFSRLKLLQDIYQQSTRISAESLFCYSCPNTACSVQIITDISVIQTAAVSKLKHDFAYNLLISTFSFVTGIHLNLRERKKLHIHFMNGASVRHVLYIHWIIILQASHFSFSLFLVPIRLNHLEGRPCYVWCAPIIFSLSDENNQVSL